MIIYCQNQARQIRKRSSISYNFWKKTWDRRNIFLRNSGRIFGNHDVYGKKRPTLNVGNLFQHNTPIKQFKDIEGWKI